VLVRVLVRVPRFFAGSTQERHEEAFYDLRGKSEKGKSRKEV
jgi:hypothetical protein